MAGARGMRGGERGLEHAGGEQGQGAAGQDSEGGFGNTLKKVD